MASTALVALALPGGAPLPEQSGVLVATRRTLARQGDHAVVAASGGARGNVELVRLSFGRFGDDLARSVGDEELLSWAAAGSRDGLRGHRRTGRLPVHRWIDAMPQYGPGPSASWSPSCARGLPPTLAVAGAYLDGIGVPACMAAATRAAASLVTTRVAK